VKQNTALSKNASTDIKQLINDILSFINYAAKPKVTFFGSNQRNVLAKTHIKKELRCRRKYFKL